MSGDWNLFRIGREPRNEQLTEMLVWLADAVPEVRWALLRLAFGDVGEADDDLTISTQHVIADGRLDAFVSSSTVALVIESKLDSSYGDDQLTRYLAWLHREFAARPFRGLMTLTARAAPWPQRDLDFASGNGIHAQARLWEELHAVLASAALSEENLATRLVREFLDMLTAEQLVPTQPLTADDLGTAWADSSRVVQRYGDFFHACVAEIAQALDAKPLSNSRSDRGDWFWQDFAFPGGARLVVGLYFSDEGQKGSGFVQSRTPLVWMAAKLDGPDQEEIYAGQLEAHPPAGWRVGRRWYGERPNVWRPLGGLLTASTFDEQRSEAHPSPFGRPRMDCPGDGDQP